MQLKNYNKDSDYEKWWTLTAYFSDNIRADQKFLSA